MEELSKNQRPEARAAQQLGALVRHQVRHHMLFADERSIALFQKIIAQKILSNLRDGYGTEINSDSAFVREVLYEAGITASAKSVFLGTEMTIGVDGSIDVYSKT